MPSSARWRAARQRQPHHNAMIGVADLVRAVALLEPDEEAFRLMAEALGFDLFQPIEAPKPAAPTAPLPESKRGERTRRSGPPKEPEVIAAPAAGEGVPFTIDPVVRTPPSTYPPEPGERLTDADTHAPLPFAPLFRPNWSRAILSTALSTNGGDGPIDLEAVVEFVARREVVIELPRLPRPTVRRGVQLLLDRSAGLSPYLRDQDELRHQIEEVVGRDRVRTFTFTGYPLPSDDPAIELGWGTFSLESDQWTETDEFFAGEYRPPLAGTVVVLLTDLGLGGPPFSSERATWQQWLEFAGMVRKAGCPLVACVPQSPLRWPPELKRVMKIVHWDRPTTAAMVRHLVGRGHEVKV